MAKYLPMHDSSQAIPKEELQNIENQYKSNSKTIAALKFIENNNENIVATIQ
ncbi:hypothetical protein [Laspinema olomoucense]|uniref:Uncharacterized protein n=1 Tax=Laspinema olomoucense D3b TaxID=2953688 RepID=A0ABT2N899_9CYAN|nr:hypothetical protein [Laspinema sp. D3b]MCT7978827.1 hypothetical protein [Laspinema sp. D3b]